VLDRNLDTVRATQLYRTLLHEIGHWVDWRTRERIPAGLGARRDSRTSRPADAKTAPFDRPWESYWQRPHSERERYAHRYSDQLRKRLMGEGLIPFERIISPQRLGRMGVRKEDFMA